MKIGFTADIHLSRRQNHPERYHALEDILAQLLSEGIETLIIAGDCFDAEGYDSVEFDNLLRSKKYGKLRIHLLPGNHDEKMDPGVFASERVVVHGIPELHQFNSTGYPFLFVPYQKHRTMGDWIGHFEGELPEHGWILVGHGDWIAGMREPNPYEPGVYMPLTRYDIERYRPAAVFLGHIHKPLHIQPVTYAGSPCSMDISETGKRRFLIIDSGSGQFESRDVNTDYLYMDETFVLYPCSDEEAAVRERVAALRKQWDRLPGKCKRIRLRLKVRGFTKDRGHLERMLASELDGIQFYEDRPPDITELLVSNETELDDIAGRVRDRLDAMQFDDDILQPERDRMLLSVLRTVYGG